MPLFFLIAGVFHPKKSNFEIVKKRVQQLLVPYFLWSFILFFFWLFLGRKYGESAALDLSPIKNFIGIFYAQGDIDYMNWGIPMWFLPSIFLTFLIFWLIKKFIQNKKKQFLVIIISVLIGFLIPRFTNINLFWSLDVSLVSLIFYTFGYYTKNYLFFNKWKGEKTSFFILGILHLIFSLFLLQEVDMYRSTYGNEFLFIINALVGVLFWCNLFKVLPIFKFLSFFGKNTIPILAMQVRSLTFIKLVLVLTIGSSVFNFTELEKIVLVLFQLLLMFPILLLINKYVPFLNGKNKSI